MYISLFDKMDEVTEAELKQDLLRLPPWRRRQALAYRNMTDRVQSAKAFILLQQCLAVRYGIDDIPQFEYGEYGKPHLPNIHFNMSHCRKGVMCVADSSPVGCDIEAIPDILDTDLLRACFNGREQELILTTENPTAEFTRLWTRKESLLKLAGTGLVDSLQDILNSDLAKSVQLYTVAEELKGYVYTVAQYTNNYINI